MSVVECERRKPPRPRRSGESVSEEYHLGGFGVTDLPSAPMPSVPSGVVVRRGAGLRSVGAKDVALASATGFSVGHRVPVLLVLALGSTGESGSDAELPARPPPPTASVGFAATSARRSSSAALLKASGALTREPPRWTISAAPLSFSFSLSLSLSLLSRSLELPELELLLLDDWKKLRVHVSQQDVAFLPPHSSSLFLFHPSQLPLRKKNLADWASFKGCCLKGASRTPCSRRCWPISSTGRGCGGSAPW